MNTNKPRSLASEAFAMANARSEARVQLLRAEAEAQTKLLLILFMKTLVLAGVGALTYFCGPKVGLGTLAVVFFFF